jgi:hypothetical protein
MNNAVQETSEETNVGDKSETFDFRAVDCAVESTESWFCEAYSLHIEGISQSPVRTQRSVLDHVERMGENQNESPRQAHQNKKLHRRNNLRRDSTLVLREE